MSANTRTQEAADNAAMADALDELAALIRRPANRQLSAASTSATSESKQNDDLYLRKRTRKGRFFIISQSAKLLAAMRKEYMHLKRTEQAKRSARLREAQLEQLEALARQSGAPNVSALTQAVQSTGLHTFAFMSIQDPRLLATAEIDGLVLECNAGYLNWLGQTGRQLPSRAKVSDLYESDCLTRWKQFIGVAVAVGGVELDNLPAPNGGHLSTVLAIISSGESDSDNTHSNGSHDTRPTAMSKRKAPYVQLIVFNIRPAAPNANQRPDLVARKLNGELLLPAAPQPQPQPQPLPVQPAITTPVSTPKTAPVPQVKVSPSSRCVPAVPVKSEPSLASMAFAASYSKAEMDPFFGFGSAGSSRFEDCGQMLPFSSPVEASSIAAMPTVPAAISFTTESKILPYSYFDHAATLAPMDVTTAPTHAWPGYPLSSRGRAPSLHLNMEHAVNDDCLRHYSNRPASASAAVSLSPRAAQSTAQQYWSSSYTAATDMTSPACGSSSSSGALSALASAWTYSPALESVQSEVPTVVSCPTPLPSQGRYDQDINPLSASSFSETQAVLITPAELGLARLDTHGSGWSIEMPAPDSKPRYTAALTSAALESILFRSRDM